MFKKTYPYVCDKCGYFHYEQRTFCEGCGSKNTVRKISKKDWKKPKLMDQIEIKSSPV
ncbi:MAG: hypothetical protein HWN81_00945 [Candidatus Lokiarchaeota archaeon]|nr:hypothetical protein [Candidatus Lokiarchaeota archaeon]